MRFLIALLFLFSGLARGSACPWIGKEASVLMRFDSDNSFNKSLSRKEVEQDLDCLKLVLANKYIAQDYYPSINLAIKIESKKRDFNIRSSGALLAAIEEVHEGIVDAHLSYSLHHGERINFFNQIERHVELKQDFQKEEVIEQDKYTYFRPGFLNGHLSQAQNQFVDYVRSHDVNLVIDLRGNGGGDDELAKALTNSLFTENQKVPSTERVQVKSLFQSAGFCISLYLAGHDSAMDFCNQVKEAMFGKNVSETLPYTLEHYRQSFQGERKDPYHSQIVLLIDSGCASSCETIVEKISLHPNARLVGQNTMGALHFSNPVTFMLPNSGIIAKVPTLFHIYENDAPEGVGYMPDEVLDYVDLETLF